ncbi:MAG: hypothetical protein IT559_06775 [Alphaproteobacteria bacterium]|nr:hypothetical protein [Alphaproteobacteria bacterium]
MKQSNNTVQNPTEPFRASAGGSSSENIDKSPQPSPMSRFEISYEEPPLPKGEALLVALD